MIILPSIADTHFLVNKLWEFGVRSRKQLLPDTFECSHYLFAGSWMDIVWRSYLLITSGSNRVKNHKGLQRTCPVHSRMEETTRLQALSNHSATLPLCSVFAMFLKNPHFRKGISLTTGTWFLQGTNMYKIINYNMF